MNKTLLPIALASALLASGCSFIPQLDRPALPVAEQFPAAASQTAGSVAAADIPWQQFFTDPRLQQVIQLALDNNRDLRVAVLNIDKARAQYQIQRSAQFPEIGVAGSGSRQPSTVTGQYVNMYTAGLTMPSWEIDFWGRIGSLKEQALAQYLATEEGRKAAQISLISNVANTWLNLQADEELMSISRRTLGTREQSIKLTKLRLDAGVTSELDFRQAQSLTESARATRAQQTRQRELDANALTQLVGQSLPGELLSGMQGKKLADLPPLADVPAGLPSDLLLRRPDVRQAEQSMIAANASIGAARAAFFPNISLTASAGFVNPELSDLFSSGSKYFSIAPSLYLPIFNAGRNRANLQVAEANQKIAVAQYEQSIQAAFRETSDALVSRQTLQEQLQAQARQLEAEQVRYKLSDLRYTNGVASYLDLLDAQRSLFALEQSVVQVRLQQLQNQVNLYKVLGGGWTEPATSSNAATTNSATTVQ
ncbi:MAG: efflux transporter outer membrane subunit [Comamonas sp.]|jgi:multidrug efflux system outer membrane protein|uniref:efflux transporter outer membrane subunit n=1 Tax=Comamonas sp. TaxID=34028 RepID=UPI00282EA2A4|nr:efflux transporter outer membrane subunit [Comamonas sp.]MDR0217162.1 efflux transporter outer membrane subunit [Comamonas sp.]